MNYRKKIREYIECPQFGNINYGKWGTLNIEQRKLIKRLLDEMDRADEYIKTLYFKNDNLQSKIDKAIRIIEEDILNKKIEEVDWDFDECYFSDMPTERIKPLIDILKEAENVENN